MWSKSYVGTGRDELVGVVAMPVGVAAFGQTDTTSPIFDDLWIIRTNIDGMVHFGADSGFDTVNGAVQWSPTSIHAQLQLAPAIVPTTATVTDALIAATAVNATNSLLTDCDQRKMLPRAPEHRPERRCIPRAFSGRHRHQDGQWARPSNLSAEKVVAMERYRWRETVARRSASA